MFTSKVIIAILSMAGLVQALPPLRGGLSLTCERAGNPCLEDQEDPRFEIVALMIEAELQLREYEAENGLSATEAVDEAMKKWSYNEEGWHKEKDEKGGRKKKGRSSSGDEDDEDRRGLRGLAKEDAGNLVEAMKEEQSHRELGGGICNNVCVSTPAFFLCEFFCKGKRRRLDQGDVCTEDVHLRSFLSRFPTDTIDECVATTSCVLSMACTE